MAKVEFVARIKTNCDQCCYKIFGPECLEFGDECQAGVAGFYKEKIEDKKEESNGA